MRFFKKINLTGMSLSPEIVVDSRTRERTFTWPGTISNRPSRTITCFYAFDNYLVSNDPLHCVEILLVDTSLIQWCNTLVCCLVLLFKTPLCVRRLEEEESVRFQPTNVLILNINQSRSLMEARRYTRMEQYSTPMLAKRHVFLFVSARMRFRILE